MKAEKPIIMVTNQDTFTDREEPRKAFWELYDGMESGDVEVIHFFGVGGEGKTTLLRKLQFEMEEKVNSKKYLYYNFEVGTSVKAILYILSRQMMMHNPKLKFPLFDTAFIRHSEMVNEDVEALVEKLNKSLFDSEIAKGFFNVAGAVIPYASQIEFFANKGLKLYKRMMEKHEHGKAEVSGIYYKINSSNVTQLLNDLPLYFAIDASENTEKMVAMLDGYEVLVNKLCRGDAAKYDDLWLWGEQMLIRSIPNMLWVIAGREKLEWPEMILPNAHKYLIGSLSEQDTMDYLQKSGIVDAMLVKHIYDLTHGTPVYLDTCVKRFHNLKNLNGAEYVLSIDDIGANTAEIAKRFLRDMKPEQQKMIHLIACLPRTWDDELVKVIARKTGYDAYMGQYPFLLELSLIQKYDDQYKLHETFRDIVLNSLNAEEKKTLFTAVNQVQKTHVETESNFTLLYGKFESFLNNLNKQDETTISIDDVKYLIESLEKYAELGDFQNANRLSDELISILIKISEMSEECFFAKARKIYYLYRLGNYQEAADYGKKTYEEARRKLNENDVAMLAVLHNYVTAIYGTGKYQQAKEMAEEVYQTRVKVLGEEHPDTLWSLNSLAVSYGALGNHQKSKELKKKTYETRVRVLGEEHPDTLWSLNNLAVSYEALGDHEEARVLYERVHEIRVRRLGEEHPDTLTTLNNLAISYAGLGDHEKAKELYEKVYKMRVRILGEEHPDTLKTLNSLAASLAFLEDYKKAKELYEKVYKTRAKILGEEHPDTIFSKAQLMN